MALDAIDMTPGFEALKAWKPPTSNDDLAALNELSYRSLQEVKGLTEYEDTKAERILIAITFLAALASAVFTVVFSALVDKKVVAPELSLDLPISWIGTVVIGGFGLYVMLVGIGASLVLKAVQPQFNVPAAWKPGVKFPPSYYFYEKILSVAPDVWVNSYAYSPVTEVRQEYIKHALMEAYIVAEKVRTKLKSLSKGVLILRWSTILLTGWLPIAVLVSAAPRLFW